MGYAPFIPFPDGRTVGQSERDAGAETEHRLIPDALRGIVGVRDAAPGSEDVLEVRLDLQPGCHLDLIGDFQESLGTTDGDQEGRRGEGVRIRIETGGGAA